MAAGEVIVDDPARLHGGIEGGRTDEAESRHAQGFCECGGLGNLGRDLAERSRRGPRRGRVGPKDLVQRRAPLPQEQRRPRIPDRRLDLPAMPDDRCVGQQPFDVPLVEPRDRLRVEAGEAGPEALALAKDRQPREPRLEALEAKPLVDATFVADRPPPLVVVVGRVEGVALAEAAELAQGSSRVTIPSSTETG